MLFYLFQQLETNFSFCSNAISLSYFSLYILFLYGSNFLYRTLLHHRISHSHFLHCVFLTLSKIILTSCSEFLHSVNDTTSYSKGTNYLKYILPVDYAHGLLTAVLPEFAGSCAGLSINEPVLSYQFAQRPYIVTKC